MTAVANSSAAPSKPGSTQSDVRITASADTGEVGNIKERGTLRGGP